ncbi:C4-dicarboxylate ABC transporter substrate-binding protein [Burkholderia sp. Tr-862]|uniref:TRAP transporter substrate-binding protein DctP n=1 Tax=Burkholderia sp. Tr-862 TaxID=2608331 RepID=UPI00141A3D88|nr:TRAP transporter substrate-binding protein DctP [Burkholderia sp. Tr-862]NIF41998.1 C4-dicarboxylate ABC transporter substrate-binding protein [Burkholderia sp. Tr-862]
MPKGKRAWIVTAQGLAGLLLAIVAPMASSIDVARGAPRPEWSIATAYPADTVSGQAAEDFARLLNEAGKDTTRAIPHFTDKHGVAGVQERISRQPFGVLFAGDLASRDAILALSIRPYEVNSIAEAREMSRVAKPAYRAALAHRDLVLLAVIPWPPTGIWSRTAIGSPSDLVGMRIRTYDESSRRVMQMLGADVVFLPIQEALDQIKAGGVDAVMSSGDGAAGRAYAEVLPNFTALGYAYPVSFLVANRHFLDGLSQHQRAVIFAAGQQTEKHAWERLPERVRQNYEGMAASGVTVRDPAPRELLDAISRAAKDDSRDSLLSDYETAQMLARFRACQPRACRACAAVADTEVTR